MRKVYAPERGTTDPVRTVGLPDPKDRPKDRYLPLTLIYDGALFTMFTRRSTSPTPRSDRSSMAVPPVIHTSVVIPTFNESANIATLLDRLCEALTEPTEIIFVDDSSDDTPEVIEKEAADRPHPIEVLHREDATGGLGGAVVEGIRLARGRWVVVMDADLQHPPDLVPALPAAGEQTGAELVVASRYAAGGSRAGLAGRYRLAVSGMSTLLAKAIFPRRLRRVSDPMSGFFAIRRDVVTPEALRPLGYKILLELIVRLRPRPVAEVPYVFGERHAGDSKSSMREGLRFLRHLLVLKIGSARAARESRST